MTIRVGINGFGRIGRCTLSHIAASGRNDIQVVKLNATGPLKSAAHLIKYDSVHGAFPGMVEVGENTLDLGRGPIDVMSTYDMDALDWEGCDVVLECTGMFNDGLKAKTHLERGAGKVLLSAPGKNVDRTVVYGVNHQELTAEDVIVSNASCTTNCLAPVAKVLDDTFGIETGYMTTIHAYTGDQPTHDSPHRDPYRGRAAALSMVPTSTGAAAAISEVIPHLKGVLEGSAVRVPTANVSLVDLCVMPKKPATAEAVNAAMQEAANGALKGVLAYEPAPLVSADFNHDPHSSTLAPEQTRVTDGGMIRVVSWYDNEWGFSNRMNDTARALAALI